MKPTKTKSEIRSELDAQVESFLSKGGEVNEVPQGKSGIEGNLNSFRRGAAIEPKTDRTPLTELVKDLEARKGGDKEEALIKPKKRRPYKKLITDDFGEPIRWVWQDDNN